MKNKKRICLTVAIIVVVSVTAGVLSGCSVPILGAEAYNEIVSAIENSVKIPEGDELITFSWFEKFYDVANAKNTESRGRLTYNKDGLGNHLKNEVFAQVIRRRVSTYDKGLDTFYEAYCGLSNDNVEYLFENERDIDRKNPLPDDPETKADESKGVRETKTKMPMTSKAFFANEMAAKGYDIASLLAELKAVLTMKDGGMADFITFEDNVSSKTGGQLVETQFAFDINSEGYKNYLDGFKAANGYDSIFQNTRVVDVEIVRGRVSKIACSRDEAVLGTSMTTPLEIYKIEIVYAGPNIKPNMPKVVEKDNKGNITKILDDWKDEATVKLPNLR